MVHANAVDPVAVRTAAVFCGASFVALTCIPRCWRVFRNASSGHREEARLRLCMHIVYVCTHRWRVWLITLFKLLCLVLAGMPQSVRYTLSQPFLPPYNADCDKKKKNVSQNPAKIEPPSAQSRKIAQHRHRRIFEFSSRARRMNTC